MLGAHYPAQAIEESTSEEFTAEIKCLLVTIHLHILKVGLLIVCNTIHLTWISYTLAALAARQAHAADQMNLGETSPSFIWEWLCKQLPTC